MKSLIIIFSILSLSCFNPKFEIINVESQDWVGGRVETGYGTNYSISLIAPDNSDNIKINKLWINGKYFEVEAAKKFPNTAKDGFQKGDTIYLYASFVQKNNSEGEALPLDIGLLTLAPQDYTTALIGYTYKKKEKYYNIKMDILKKEKLLYP